MSGTMSIYEIKNLADLGSSLENSENFYSLDYFINKVGLMNQAPTQEKSKA